MHFIKFRSSWAAGVLVLLAALAVTVPAHAAAITFDFSGGNSQGTIGNTRTFTSGGITVSATAWTYSSSFAAAELGQWDLGLGVCTSSEDNWLFGCQSPDHQVDNSGSDDYVLFLFSQAIDPANISITTVSHADLDVTYWLGNPVLPSDKLAGDTIAGLSGRGFGAEIDDSTPGNGSGNGTRLVSLPQTGYVTGLLFGSKYGDNNDAFKITSLTVDPGAAPVPEPASMLLLGVGLFGVCARLRRR